MGPVACFARRYSTTAASHLSLSHICSRNSTKAHVHRRSSRRQALGVKNLCMICLLSFLRITITVNLYFEGIHVSSSSIVAAMSNLTPTITFIITVSIGWEKIDIGSKKSMAKVLGTTCYVRGAIFILVLRGPKIPNLNFHTQNSMFLLGCLLLLASDCCQSLWMILQVPVSKLCPENPSLSALMCFMATLQSAALALFLEPDPTSWIIKSSFELQCVIYIEWCLYYVLF
ncbi:PREDICTED: WAT1-related protein At4g30420-like [Nelumbo nucifera]|uniref:WAT1-related protein At4g30420-like n=1 Tax=Nelumbo nucifera TaxID=4432 RepID=A0A1U8PZK4_NELNU|nr:PREDICTED: WAT1-related protein At4g30420-like [Nelumbo nucifera]